jgi:hypothetical protein
MPLHRCRLLAPRLAGILRGTNFQRAEPKILGGGTSYLKHEEHHGSVIRGAH